MTFITRIAGGEPAQVFTHLPLRTNERASGTGVATHTHGGQRSVIHFCTGPYGGTYVASIAGQRGWDMPRWVFAFERQRAGAVVATCTGRRRLNLSVIKLGDGLPQRRCLVVTGIANVARIDAALVFARHHADVGKARRAVTTGTVTDEARVVYGRGFPTRNSMTSAAGLNGRNVSCQTLARCQGPVVACRTHRDAGLCMVKFDDGLPFTRRFAVAGIAHVAGGESVLVFARHDADVGEAWRAMAASAVASEADVIYVRRFPARHDMAGIAGLGGGNMSCRALAHC